MLQQDPKTWRDPAVQQAIKDSVLATSTGNPDQDVRIQRAIETSVDQLQQAARDGKDDEGRGEYERAQSNGGSCESKSTGGRAKAE